MKPIDLKAGLQSLRASARQLESLTAWRQLQAAEARSSCFSGFPVHDILETDLRNEYSFFLSISLQMHAVLNDRSLDISKDQRLVAKRQLARIEQRVCRLRLPSRL